jgi:hypothetical protein
LQASGTGTDSNECAHVFCPARSNDYLNTDCHFNAAVYGRAAGGGIRLVSSIPAGSRNMGRWSDFHSFS